MKTIGDMISYLLITATMQNLVLTTGFGSSSLARMLRRPRQRHTFSRLLLGFTVATTALFWPIDKLLPATWYLRMLRPLIIVVLTSLLYVATVLIANRRFPDWYRRVRRFVPLAAFNNIVIGVALVTNYQFSVSFLPAIGMAIGSALGFSLVSSMSAEALERLDNPDTPMAFRGLPGTLVYLGLLALALMGFRPILNLV
ncbi:MAG: hypothetical protein IKB04_07455 [Clostridia bacterium]|nr:hypothetical protein [Clostridia bacterium]